MVRPNYDRPKWLRKQPVVAPPSRAERIATHQRMVERMKARRLAGDTVLEIAWDFGMTAAQVKHLLEIEP